MKDILVYRALNSWYALVNLDNSNKIDEIKLRSSTKPMIADWQTLTDRILVERSTAIAEEK